MKIHRSCRESTRLLLQSQERQLAPLERLSLQLHWLVCKGCRGFRDQARLMQEAMQRWRSYREGD